LKEIFNKPSKEFDFKFNSIRIRNSSDQKGNNTFRIDTSRIISASIGGNLYYTLPVIQISSNNSFDNIVIGDLDSGHMTFHLLRYYYNDSIYGDLVNVKSNGIDKIQIRELTSSELNDFLNKSTYKSTSCYGVTSTFCDWGGETHSAGPNCTQTYTVTQHYCIQTADWWTYYNFINGPGGGNNTGGNPGNEYIDPNDPYTQPITPPEMFAGGLDYHLDLSMAEYNWALTNTEEAARIMEFLDDNNFSSNSKDFANKALPILLNNGSVYFDSAYIPIATPDDNYSYQGPKELIPTTINLANGDVVNIEFGVTSSDGISANQKIATHLIEGLKFALNEANNNLNDTDKITDLYIMATTNGVHGPYSNHSNGTAIDISRINNVKMALSENVSQISELQNAFDNYEFIRENFGPYFKHKYSIENNTWNYNHPVGGHSDHIHISTRK